MRFVVFCHSLVSDWNHGNAHFLRGVVAELGARGHDVAVHEPLDGWSRANLVAEHGREAVVAFERRFPELRSRPYDLSRLDAAELVAGADVVIVHEWNDPELVATIGRERRRNDFRLLFHDTHHRMATAPHEMARFDLGGYDGVLAFGQVIRDLYLERAWSERAWTWHEAADVRVFHPVEAAEPTGDLVWIGNWGDGERSAELHEFLVEPARALGLRATVHGVRYPADARQALADAGISFGGWVANHAVPAVFAAHAVTVHVPRGPYVRALPGIPTIRPFEAMACGIPLVSAPWDDLEGLFRPGVDHLVARSGDEARRSLAAVLGEPELAASLRAEGLATIRARHTCAHRVDELLEICAELGMTTAIDAGGNP
jgi:spore maturation protein CgeB